MAVITARDALKRKDAGRSSVIRSGRRTAGEAFPALARYPAGLFKFTRFLFPAGPVKNKRMLLKRQSFSGLPFLFINFPQANNLRGVNLYGP